MRPDSRWQPSTTLAVFTWTAAFSSATMGQDLIVPTNTTLTDTVVIEDDGFTVTVEPNGAIDTTTPGGGSSANGIEAGGAFLVVTGLSVHNAGEIAGGANGVQVFGNNNTVVNEGHISGGGIGVTFARNLEFPSFRNILHNWGSISGTDFQGVRFAERASFDGNTGSHSGELHNHSEIHSVSRAAVEVSTTNGYNYSIVNYAEGQIWSDDRDGVYVATTDGFNNSVTNYGTIWSNGQSGVEFNISNGYANTLTNYGEIYSSGLTTASENRAAVFFSNADGHLNRLVNYGSIKSEGAPGVEFSNSFGDGFNNTNMTNEVISVPEATIIRQNNALINYGVIESESSHGVLFDGMDRTDDFFNAGRIVPADGYDAVYITGDMAGINMTLAPGSVLEGGVSFGGTQSSLTLVGNQSIYLDYVGSLESVSAALPVANDTANTVVFSVDPSGIAMVDPFFQLHTGAMHSTVRSRDLGENTEEQRYPEQTDRGQTGFTSLGFEQDRRIWATAFGGLQSLDGTTSLADVTSSYAGIVSGVDFSHGPHARGVFLGASNTELEAEDAQQQLDARSTFAGIYGRTWLGAYQLDGVLAFGAVDFSSGRTIANNVIASGIEEANSDYDGWFVSPSISASRSWSDKWTVEVGGGYSGLFVDEYTETGASAGLTVASRELHFAFVHAQADYVVHEHKTNTGAFSVTGWGGIEAGFNFGDDEVTGVLDGIELAVPATYGNSNLSALVGVSARHSPDQSGWSFYGGVETRTGSDIKLRTSFEAGLSIEF